MIGRIRALRVTLEMFSWNDEEISEIIWGEPGDSDDHIVPFQERHEGTSSFPIRQCDKKSSILDDNNAVKTGGNNKHEVVNDALEDKVEASEYNTDEQLAASGFNLAWSNLPTYNVNITAQDSMGTEASKDFSAMENFNLGKGVTELFGNEHRDTDGDSFLDYSWANIGNFDDLDRLFRNDESILGLGNANELWSSSPVADMISNSPVRLFSIPADSPGSDFQGSRSTAAHYKVKLELPPYQDEPIDPASGNKNDFGFSGPPVLPSKDKSADIVNQAEDSTETTAETATLHSHQITENRSCLSPVADKINKPKKLAKNRKKPEVNCGKFSNAVSSTWPPGANSFQECTNSRMPVSALQAFPSSVYGGSQSLSYLHATNPYAHMGYGYPVHQFPVVPHSQNVNSEKDPVMNSYKISSEPTKHLTKVQMPAGVQAKVPAMTPREKIEKLRRRQQMQALLAIQQQQLKLGHQISDHNWIKDEQHQDAVLSNAEADENASTIHLQSSLELNFSSEQKNGSRMILDEYSLAERIFLQLQEAVTKIDNKTRLCIRDSLFRLAKSAIQRHAVSDRSSTNKNSRDEGDFHGFEETNSHERAANVSEAETDTNPIDRTVAQLLFQGPSDPSSGPPMVSPVPSSPEKYHFNLKAENGEPAAESLSELSDKQNQYDSKCSAVGNIN